MTEHFPANARAERTTTQDEVSAHARAVGQLGRWAGWTCYVGNIIALGGCMAMVVSWARGYNSTVALRYNLTGLGIWLIMVSVDQLLLRRTRKHLELLRAATWKPRNAGVRRW